MQHLMISRILIYLCGHFCDRYFIYSFGHFMDIQHDMYIVLNFFSDLSPLSNLPYLLILDVSHNKLTTVLDFEPPKNLREVDLSYNEVEIISDLSRHQCLTKFNLDSILCLRAKKCMIHTVTGLFVGKHSHCLLRPNPKLF